MRVRSQTMFASVIVASMRTSEASSNANAATLTASSSMSLTERIDCGMGQGVDETGVLSSRATDQPDCNRQSPRLLSARQGIDGTHPRTPQSAPAHFRTNDHYPRTAGNFAI